MYTLFRVFVHLFVFLYTLFHFYFVPLQRELKFTPVNLSKTIIILNLMKQKSFYERPYMRVVELRGRQQILAGSGLGKSATMNVTYEEEDI